MAERLTVLFLLYGVVSILIGLIVSNYHVINSLAFAPHANTNYDWLVVVPLVIFIIHIFVIVLNIKGTEK